MFEYEGVMLHVDENHEIASGCTVIEFVHALGGVVVGLFGYIQKGQRA
jgi:hypothetical protein